jgi:5-formyltetrahydrofolate cyclo-ligase
VDGPPRHSHKLAPEEHIRLKVKAELRKRLRALRATTPLEACQERSAKIRRRLLALRSLQSARGVALFWPIVEKHEVDLRPLDTELRASGVRIAYPSIDPETREMTFRFVDDTALLEERGFGFREPPLTSAVARRGELDVVVVPAIGVSPDGHRIGYGAGYYDRTLPSVAPPATTIAVAYDFQLLAEVPTTVGDEAVRIVVTDARDVVVTP